MFNERDEELVKACREGNLYDFISNNGYRFSKEELIEIVKQLTFSIYQRLGDQNNEVENLLPANLDEYYFFENLTADEVAYLRYLSGSYSYQNYIDVCEHEDVKEPRPRK